MFGEDQPRNGDKGKGEDNPFVEEQKLERAISMDLDDPDFRLDLISSSIKRLFAKGNHEGVLKVLKKAVVDGKLTGEDYNAALEGAIREDLMVQERSLAFSHNEMDMVDVVQSLYGSQLELLRIALGVHQENLKNEAEYLHGRLAKLEASQKKAAEALDGVKG